MDWKTVLVPLDGSHIAEAALPYAEAIADAMGASIVLLSVADTEPFRMVMFRDDATEREALENGLRAPLSRYLESTAQTLRDRGISVSTSVKMGDPAGTILASADESDAALIVMATHGRGGAARWLLGSVADKVMRLGVRPTLLVRAPESDAKPGTVKLRQLMLPLDGSPLSESVFSLARDLAVAARASITLVQVVPWLSAVMEPYDPSTYTPNLDETDAAVVAAAEDYLAGLAERLPASVQSYVYVLRGPTSLALQEFAQSEGIDLVVMATRGWGGVRRAVVGSKAERLVRSGVPSLLVHPPRQAQASEQSEQAEEVR